MAIKTATHGYYNPVGLHSPLKKTAFSPHINGDAFFFRRHQSPTAETLRNQMDCLLK